MEEQNRELSMPIGENLLNLRKKKGYTRKELETLSGVTENAIFGIEMSGKEPKLKTLKKLVIALECTTDELIFDDDERRYDQDMELVFEQLEKLDKEQTQTIKQVVRGLVSSFISDNLRQKT